MGWFQNDSISLHLLCTLFLLLLHQLHLRSSGIRSQRLGTPALLFPFALKLPSPSCTPVRALLNKKCLRAFASMFPELHGSLNELEPEASKFSGKAPGEAEAQTPVLPRNTKAWGSKVASSSQGVSLLPWSCSHLPVFAQSWKPAAGGFQTMLCSPLPGYWGVDQSWLGQEKSQGKEEGVSLPCPSRAAAGTLPSYSCVLYTGLLTNFSFE